MRLRGSVAIDLGTVNTLVWVAGRGIVLEEPSAIAIDTAAGSVAAVGVAADALADKEPQGIEVLHPLRDGVIADLDATAAMLHAFLRKARRRHGPLRSGALVCVPAGATEVERRSVMAALSVRRPRYNVRLIDEPVAAAAGAGFDLSGGSGGFVVDIGGGTTEVAVVAGWRVARAASLRKAGNAMDDAILYMARNELGLILSQRAARELKMTLGITAGATMAETVGIDAATRVPRTELVSGARVAEAIEPIVSAIADQVLQILSEIPPGLAEDVVRGKIRLAGGGSLLPGLPARIEAVAGIGTVLAEDPLRCVIRGAAEILERGKKGLGPGLRQLTAASSTRQGGSCAAGPHPTEPARREPLRGVLVRAECGWSAVLEDGQDVARGVGEPGDERSAASADALGVLVYPLVTLEVHAPADQFVDGRVDVLDQEVEDGVRGRRVVGLRVDQRVAVASQVQREQTVLLGHLYAERLTVELPGLVKVVDGEPAECLAVLEHEMLLP
jgi:rod shape-determining protein MreB